MGIRIKVDQKSRGAVLGYREIRFPGIRPKCSNCKLSSPVAASIAAASRQILKSGSIEAWLGFVGLASDGAH
jgi:hypothetical protein